METFFYKPFFKECIEPFRGSKYVALIEPFRVGFYIEPFLLRVSTN